MTTEIKVSSLLEGEERVFQEQLVAHFTAIQSINEAVLDTVPLSPFTKQILANRYKHNKVGISGLDLSNPSSSTDATVIASCLTFGITGLLGGIFLAVPATAIAAALTITFVDSKIYTVLSDNQDDIVSAARFYSENIGRFSSYVDGANAVADKRDMSTKEFANTFLDLSRAFQATFSGFQVVDALDEVTDKVMSREDSIAKVRQPLGEGDAAAEASAKQRTAQEKPEHQNEEESEVSEDISELDFTEDSSDPNYTESSKDDEDEINHADAVLRMRSSHLVLSVELPDLDKYCSKMGVVSELELLVTISAYESFAEVTTDEIEAEKIKNVILPRLREAVAFQTRQQA